MDILPLKEASDARATTLGLRRQLGLASATAAVAGESIAVGIFLTPAGMAKSLGSPFWMLLVWVAVGALTLSGALCYGELVARFPRDGGVYVYLQETLGRRIAFLYGWMCLLVLDPGLTAVLAIGLASYAAYVFPIPVVAIKLIAIAVIWTLCVLNILSSVGHSIMGVGCTDWHNSSRWRYRWSLLRFRCRHVWC